MWKLVTRQAQRRRISWRMFICSDGNIRKQRTNERTQNAWNCKPDFSNLMFWTESEPGWCRRKAGQTDWTMRRRKRHWTALEGRLEFFFFFTYLSTTLHFAHTSSLIRTWCCLRIPTVIWKLIGTVWEFRFELCDSVTLQFVVLCQDKIFKNIYFVLKIQLCTSV